MRLGRRSLLILSALGLAPRTVLGAPPLPGKTPTARTSVPPRLSLRGARVLSADAPPLEDSLVELDGGKITRVVSGGEPAKGSQVIEAKGMTLTAGFVDLVTGTGLMEVELERSSRNAEMASKNPIRAAYLAADGYDPAASAVGVTRAGGVTSVGVVPSGGLISGQSAWIDLDDETSTTNVVVRRLALHVGLNNAWYEGEQVSVGASLLALRELFDDARELSRNPGGFDKNQMRKLVASRLDLRAVAESLAGKLPVIFEVDRAADILSVLELARANKLKAVIASAAEGWKVADALAKAKTPVINFPLDNLPRTFSARFVRDDNAARLAAAGVPLIIASGEVHNARKLRQIAGNAVRAGLPHATALDAVTRAPASAFALDKRYGRVAAGLVANLTLWSGDPFELSTKVEAVFLRGRRASLENRQTALFQRYKAPQR
ncbi:MAG: amidohydrolase family protein [Myxococcales bacterium]|nr:amidohydrolase family protein [Myxococcales bacterium]